MTLMRQKMGTGLFLAVAGFMVSAFVASSAFAQAPPYTAYGTTGLEEGQVVEVFAGGESCGSDTVTAEGEWGPIYVGTDECPAEEGEEITFTVDGQPAVAEEAPVTFVAGGAPENAAVGLVLVVDGVPADDTADDVADDDPPAPAPTGNAGLVGSGASSSLVLVMLLGVLGAVLVAGARVATRRS